MRRLALLALGVACGALAVSGQEGAGEDALAREIDRLTRLITERLERQAPRAQQRVVFRTYDIADLCSPLRERGQAPEDLVRSGDEVPAADPDTGAFGPLGFDRFAEFLMMGAEPESWDTTDRAQLEIKNGHLLVSAIPRVQAKVERLLAWFRATMDRRLSVDVAVAAVRAEDAAILSGTHALTAEAAERLRSEAIATVSLAGWDGQLLGGRAGREISYVGDYDMQIAEGAVIGDPVTQKGFAGCSAEVRACLDEGRGAILHCRIEWSRVALPLPVHPTGHGDIELPTKKLTRVLTSFWAPLGQTVVAGGCIVGEEPCVILVTVRRG